MKYYQKLWSKFHQKSWIKSCQIWWTMPVPKWSSKPLPKLTPFELKKRCAKLIENDGVRTLERDNPILLILVAWSNFRYPVRGSRFSVKSTNFCCSSGWGTTSSNGINFGVDFESTNGINFIARTG